MLQQLSDKLLTEEQLFVRLGRFVSPQKFAQLRRQGLVPFVRLGHKTYRYVEADVRRALRKLTVKETPI
jgi:hypothetical protein